MAENTNLSTFEQMFRSLRPMNGLLGTEIKEFMNVFKFIHGYQGSTEGGDGEEPPVTDEVEANGMITEEMTQIYKRFVQDHREQGEKTEDYTLIVENYTSEYLPVLPKIVYMTNFKDNGLTDYRIFELIPKERDEDKLKVTVSVESGEVGNVFTLAKYKDHVTKELKKYVKPQVFKYFAEPVKNLDEINKSNKTSFSNEFKKLKIYSGDEKTPGGFSLLDYLLKFATDPKIIVNDVVDLKDDNEERNYDTLVDIADMLELYKNTSRPDNMNSLVVDVMENQKKIDSTKDKVSALRKKLYTFMSRDDNYTSVLNSNRRGLMIILIALIVTIILFVGLALTTMLPVEKQALALAAAASLWPTIHIIKVVFDMLTSKKKVREGFVNDEELGFKEETIGEGQDETTTRYCNRPLALANFVDKFSEVLSAEIKQEYFDALSESQEKDIAMLQQLENEHSVSSHFHQLKNNLTHYKIRESNEFKKMTWNGLLLVSLVAMIYALKLQDTLSEKMFKFIAGIVGVSYVTYILLTYKGMMMRDKSDWDRFHWVVNKLESKSDGGSCNGLSGFARN